MLAGGGRFGTSGGFPGPAPLGASPEATSPLLVAWSQQQALNEQGWGTVYSSANSLPRTYDAFRSGQFMPMEPILPVPIDVPEGDGRPRPRRFQYPVGWNLPVGSPGTEGLKLATFQVLREIAEPQSVTRTCIEISKSDVMNLEFDIVPTQDAQRAMQGNPAKRTDFEKRKAEIMEFFKNPDPSLVDGIDEWMNVLLEDSIVLDAAAIYVQPAGGKGNGPMGSDVGALCLIDASTVRPLLNVNGARPEPPQPAYQQCYSADTEVLTRRRGWVLFDALTTSDEVATRSVGGDLEWQQPERVIRQSYEGEMLRFYSRTLDLFVTPDHRMLVDHRPRALGGGGNRWHSDGECMISAGELASIYPQSGRSDASKSHAAGCAQARFTACANWKGEELREFVLPAIPQRTGRGRRPSLGPASLSGDDFAAFMGMWLAEGSLTHVGGQLKTDVLVAQSPSSKGYEPFREVLERVAGPRLRSSSSGFVFAADALARWLDQFGKASEKFIPPEIMEMSARQLAIFWKFYGLGDGRSGDGAIVTVSKRMADQLQEVALRLGHAASVRPHSTPGAWVVSPHATRWRSWNVESFLYEGEVVCATVPNGTLYVRRNGYPSFQGNCVWGVPRVDLMDLINLGPDATLEEIKDLNPVLMELTEEVDQWRGDQLIYLKTNPRSFTPYGFGPVEQGLLPSTIMSARMVWQFEFFRSGSLPSVFLDPGESIATAEEARQLQESINMLGGDLAGMHQIIVLPPGAKPTPQKPVDLTSQFDEWIVSLIVMPFGLSISDLGITPKVSGLTSPQSAHGSAQAAMDRTVKRSTVPRTKKLKRKVFDRIIQGLFGQQDMEWSWGIEEQGDSRSDLVTQNINLVEHGVMTIDEARIALEMDPFGMPETTMPVVMTPTGVVSLRSSMAQGEATAQNAVAGSPGAAPPGLPPGPPRPSGGPSGPSGGQPALPPGKPNSRPGDEGTTPAHEASEAVTAAPPDQHVSPEGKAVQSELRVLLRYLRRGGDVEHFKPVALRWAAVHAARGRTPELQVASVTKAQRGLDVREKALAPIRAEVARRFGQLVRQNAPTSKAAGGKDAFVRGGQQAMSQALADAATAGTQAAMDESDDADSLTAADSGAIAASRASAIAGYLADFAQAVAAGDGSMDDWMNRAQQWAQSITPAYEEGYVTTGTSDPDSPSMIEWELGSSEEPCENCLELDGQQFTQDDLPGYPGDGTFGEGNSPLCLGGPMCSCRLSIVTDTGEQVGASTEETQARQQMLGQAQPAGLTESVGHPWPPLSSMIGPPLAALMGKDFSVGSPLPSCFAPFDLEQGVQHLYPDPLVEVEEDEEDDEVIEKFLDEASARRALAMYGKGFRVEGSCIVKDWAEWDAEHEGDDWYNTSADRISDRAGRAGNAATELRNSGADSNTVSYQEGRRDGYQQAASHIRGGGDPGDLNAQAQEHDAQGGSYHAGYAQALRDSSEGLSGKAAADAAHQELGAVAPHLGEVKAVHDGQLSPPDEPDTSEVGFAGVALRAEDTGRVLLQQRSLPDGDARDDAAGGTWEFPGGGMEDNETPYNAAVREFTEETGIELPSTSRVADTWVSPVGNYQTFLLSIPSESDVTLNERAGDPAGTPMNPDDPDGDCPEVAAWYDPQDLQGMSALRQEIADDLPNVLRHLGTPAGKAAEASQPRMQGSSIDEQQVYDYLQQHYPDGDIGWVRRCLWTQDNVLLKDVDWQHRPGGIDQDKVDDMADKLRSGDWDMHPVVLVAGGGADGELTVADGYHRCAALDKAGTKVTPAWVGVPKPGNTGWAADVQAMQFTSNNMDWKDVNQKAVALHKAVGWDVGLKVRTSALKDSEYGERGTEALRQWYEDGADGQINWGDDGDFDQCVSVAGQYIDDPEGYCQLRHMAATGMTTSEHAQESKAAAPEPTPPLVITPPTVNVSVRMPKQKRARVKVEQPAVHVDVAAPEVTVEPAQVHVDAPRVTVEAPPSPPPAQVNVRTKVKRQKRARVKVSAPEVHVEPQINVEAPKPPQRRLDIKRNPDGSIKRVSVQPESE